ncbi:hypothetical protein TWF694_004220 [Orbilia ellipsospora]|uniref:Nucleoside phosphorylase domain-containing protein n=1 Tax=Orbilia ellipsospora TaxID=2528407 RepID=A0AAV9WZW3_9PEZI
MATEGRGGGSSNRQNMAIPTPPSSSARDRRRSSRKPAAQHKGRRWVRELRQDSQREVTKASPSTPERSPKHAPNTHPDEVLPEFSTLADQLFQDGGILNLPPPYLENPANQLAPIPQEASQNLLSGASVAGGSRNSRPVQNDNGMFDNIEDMRVNDYFRALLATAALSAPNLIEPSEGDYSPIGGGVDAYHEKSGGFLDWMADTSLNANRPVMTDEGLDFGDGIKKIPIQSLPVDATLGEPEFLRRSEMSTDSGYASTNRGSFRKFDQVDASSSRTDVGGQNPAETVDDEGVLLNISLLIAAEVGSNIVEAIFSDLHLEALNIQAKTEVLGIITDIVMKHITSVGKDIFDDPYFAVCMNFYWEFKNTLASRYEQLLKKDEETYRRALDALERRYDQFLSENKKTLEQQEKGADMFPKPSTTHGVDQSQLIRYIDSIPKSPSYQRLCGAVHREVYSTLVALEGRSCAMKNLQRSISGFLRSEKAVGSESVETVAAAFILDWDASRLVYESGSQQSLAKSLSALISLVTLTGTAGDAQAVTCGEYLRQTWPVTGSYFVRMLENLGGVSSRVIPRPDFGNPQIGVRTRSRAFCTAYQDTFPDDTTITIAHFVDRDTKSDERSRFVVEVSGTSDTILEIGEQLAWLGSPFRPSISSSSMDKPIYCSPLIRDARVAEYSDSLSMQWMLKLKRPISQTLKIKRLYIFNVGFLEQPIEDSGKASASQNNCQCWHELFKNRTIVQGYPIPSRPSQGTGLEIPLDVMAALVGTQRVGTFKGKIFIKGFSRLAVPIRREGNIVIWHLVSKGDPEGDNRISYLEKIPHHAGDVSIPELLTARHILGWCPTVLYCAGDKSSDYGVRTSLLPESQYGNLLHQVRVSKGVHLKGSRQFNTSFPDERLEASRGIFVQRLKWLHTQYFILWDECDKLGWLVNGTSTLLHLLQKSIKLDSTGECSSKFCLTEELEPHKKRRYKPDSAISVFLNDRLMELVLYQDKGGVFRVRDRVEEFYDILEKLIDHQIGVMGDAAITDISPRGHLEGWDFNDIARGKELLRPRVTGVKAKGKGWVDFTRAVHAVTLFGRGFGKIMQPFDPNSKVSEDWKELQSGLYYMAASMYDLAKIMGLEPDEKSLKNPERLAGNIDWYSPFNAPSQKGAGCQSPRHECHEVQVLLPSKYSSKFRETMPAFGMINLRDDGAVVFGYNPKFQWHWDDTGDPVKGEPFLLSPPASKQRRISSGVKDSGIGSLESSSVASRAYAGAERKTNSADSISRTCVEYRVGIVCALSKELKAVRALFDDQHPELAVPSGDTNHYVLGRIGNHNVVAACLPAGEYGTCAAASVFSHMKRSYTEVKVCLLVGIGGGVPSKDNDIRLGDVIVSNPKGAFNGVVQYDLGKIHEKNRFKVTGSLQRPDRFVMTAVSKLLSDPELDFRRQPLQPYIESITSRFPEYRFPGEASDILFPPDAVHPSTNKTCADCERPLERKPRQPANYPTIHHGLIASGNQLVKSAETRDRLSAKYKNEVLCIEMEAAGIMNEGISILVIRSICDYADSHKNKTWQEYACATAAAYAKLLLTVMRSSGSPDQSTPTRTTASPNKRKRSVISLPSPKKMRKS